MSLIRLNDVSIRFENTQILREAFFRLEPGDRVGLIGRNGSGKSTILKLVLGQVSADAGTVTLEAGTRVGYFSQFSELNGESTITEVLDGLFAPIKALEAELASIDARIAADSAQSAELDRLIHRQAELFEDMDRLDGWDYPRRIDAALTTLGFDEAHRVCAIDLLSGGWRNRAALAKILLERPDVLLLDEPTNYLDVAGVEWLEAWFRSFRGAAIIVSHDRRFLDGVVTRIIEVENYHLHEYPGNFGDYVVQKQFRLKTLELQFLHESELLAFEAEGISDRREAAKAASRTLDSQLAHIKKTRSPRPVDTIITEIYGGLHVKDSLCRIESLSKSYGEKALFTDLTFEIRRGNRIVVLGSNGSGKTTLLRVLAGEEKADFGEVAWASGAAVVSYNQVLDGLDDDDTVSHSVNAMPGSLAFTATRKSVNRFLAMFQFSEADLKQKIGNLSGGQRARVAMAQCLLSGAAVLLLDEPTNHLDLASTQVMERALIHFPGAVVVVSHDRFFTDKIATRHLIFGSDAAAPGEILVRAA
ncbi:ABC-F family ATP-binding cassette domain-containing protein [Cryobacterium sp. TMT2-17-1]|uniref:ABC-F family ATP-binding cassette domain-containing protein n=1 Tax=unclassified Cryobacterium TaxID=2649013 RepID=UPI000CE525EC|nr:MULTISPECIES: ABC-F family ATP-binding cassette domain-containing protein [unclassified Cryobacterium]TFB59488.1 ABC-F family ATP-binding cassette domain-containing protein [Cryobacterium sp. Hz7]TFB60507.1 ABC-F family ATP-binding cassette domain-containing protein [Cryobacterium sp. Sr3]TFC54357.1 ABC-F family ATP-binding cassette domain-containing protein [Cryobacterium sp. TMT2-17-1]